MGEWTKGRLHTNPMRAGLAIEREDGRTIGAAHKLGNAGEPGEAIANAARLVACWNALQGIPDPAAFMGEVRDGLNKIAECESARRSGGPAPEDLEGLDDALAEAVSIAAALLDRMGRE